MHNQDPQAIFTAHVTALGAGDIDRLLALRSPESVLITAERTYRGPEQIGSFYRKLLVELPNARWALGAQVFDCDVLYIEWTCQSDKHAVADGVDTFVFRDGVIAAQTARCTLALSRLAA